MSQVFAAHSAPELNFLQAYGSCFHAWQAIDVLHAVTTTNRPWMWLLKKSLYVLTAGSIFTGHLPKTYPLTAPVHVRVAAVQEWL